MCDFLQKSGQVLLILIVASTLQSATITITDSVIANTQNYIGTVEGGHFNIHDLLDCGINSIRLYGDMVRLEPEDDNIIYGSPSIDSIKADYASGFSNTIPWEIWDSVLTNSTYWGTGVSFDELLTQCFTNKIEVILGLRPVSPEGYPIWAPRSPYDTSDWNEWWEYCFAVAYWCNVRHNYNISHFQIHNEPDFPSQGWDGTLLEYIELTKYGADAIRFANSFAGTETFIHAPVVAIESSEYIFYTIQQADSVIDVLDYHEYTSNQTDVGKTVYSTILNYDNDGVIEPVWNSEWGTYSASYNNLNMALRMANNLFDFSLFDTSVGTHCLGTNQFVMWDWGPFDGLVNSDSSRNETYYVFRLCCRCMQGGKEILQTEYNGNERVMVTRDSSSLYVSGLGVNDSLFVDVSQIGVDSEVGDYYIYDNAHKDSLVDTLLINGGKFAFFCPESALVCVKIERKYGIEEQLVEHRVPIISDIKIYPNLFTQVTSVSYQVTRKSKISLKVYDVVGRMVKTLISGEKEAGYYNVSFDAKKLQGGIYFVRFAIGDYKLTKKLILLK